VIPPLGRCLVCLKNSDLLCIDQNPSYERKEEVIKEFMRRYLEDNPEAKRTLDAFLQRGNVSLRNVHPQECQYEINDCPLRRSIQF